MANEYTIFYSFDNLFFYGVMTMTSKNFKFLCANESRNPCQLKSVNEKMIKKIEKGHIKYL